MDSVTIHYQRRWRLADDKGKSVAEGFTSREKAQQWAEEKGLEVKARAKQTKPLDPPPIRKG